MNHQLTIATSFRTLNRWGGGGGGALHLLKKRATILFVLPLFSSEEMNCSVREKFNCLMFFYDNKILTNRLARNWFTNVKVLDVMPKPFKATFRVNVRRLAKRLPPIQRFTIFT